MFISLRALALFSLILLSTAAGCGGGGDADQDQAGGSEGGLSGTVRIGAIYPTSGEIASAGVNALHGVELAVAVLNGEHEEIDIQPLANAKIELVKADSQGDPQVGASEVDRLVRNEDVAAIVGAYQSSVSLTASRRAERLGVPFVNGASGAAELSDQGLEWWFRTGPTSVDLARTYLEWLDELEKPVERVAVIFMNDAFGNDFAKVITHAAETNGLEVVESIRFQPGATSLSSEVQRLRSSKPDAVFATMFIDDTALFLRTMRQLNYTPPALLAAGGGWDDPTLVDVVGDLADFNIRAVPWGEQVTRKNTLAAEVDAAFFERYDVHLNGDSARTFTAMITLGQALERAGSTDPEKIREALRETDVSETIMPWRGIRFDERGQNTEGGYLILQRIKGEWQALFPSELATAEVVWPMPPFRER